MRQRESSRILVGFAGPIGGGKDTLAQALVEILGGQKAKFAGPLYEMAACYDPAFDPDMPHSAKDDWVLGREELGTRRAFIQKLGTEFGRNLIHSTCWTAPQKRLMDETEGHLFYSDVRFEDEAALVREEGGHIIHLKPDWIATDPTCTHASEAGLSFYRGDSIIGLRSGQVAAAIESCLAIIADLFPPST